MPRRGEKKRQYSDEEKAYALEMVEIYEGNVYKAARFLQMPLRTLKHWVAGKNRNASVDSLQEEKREEMHEALDRMAWKIISGMEVMIEDATLKEAAIALGVCIDKAQLLKGKATQRTEVSGVDGGAISVSVGLDQLSDDELRQRLAAAIGGAAGGTLPPAA